MALETLKGVRSIGGFLTLDLDAAKTDPYFLTSTGEFDWERYDEYRKNTPISICHSQNMISFRIQQGPVKETGINGCQVDTLVHAAKDIIKALNGAYPCRENSLAITKLEEAIMWLDERKRDRSRRGVEGFNKE